MTPFSHSGHTFQAIVRSEAEAGYYTTPANDTDSPVPIPAIPMRRDVFMVRPDGHYVIRFRSDNPGVRLLPSVLYLFQLKLTYLDPTGLALSLPH